MLCCIKPCRKTNILPITTVCNVRCAFCSHNQNPPEVQAIAIPHLDFDMIADLLDYLDGDRKIIIGESTSLIMEGEPFTHPRFFDVLEPKPMDNLDAMLEGLIFDSPAEKTGLQYGDVITSIDGKCPFSRLEAFSMLKTDGTHTLQWRRANHMMSGTIKITGMAGGKCAGQCDYPAGKKPLFRRKHWSCRASDLPSLKLL